MTTGATEQTVDDDLWSAIGDPTRRRMLDQLLADGAGTATSLSDRLPVTRQAVAKHLVVLGRVGLVHGTPVGREHRYRVDETQLARAVAQLSSVGATWDARLRRIKRIAETIQRRQDEDARAQGSATEPTAASITQQDQQSRTTQQDQRRGRS